MKLCQLSIGLVVVAIGFGAAPASAQMNPIILAAPQNNSMGQIMAIRARQMEEATERDVQRRKAPAPRTLSEQQLRQQSWDAVQASLLPEFKRRTNEYGAKSANDWFVTASGALGRQLKGLKPQYQQRIRSQGQAAAISWFLNTARAASLRYVQESRSAP